jgi:protein SCO1/2
MQLGDASDRRSFDEHSLLGRLALMALVAIAAFFAGVRIAQAHADELTDPHAHHHPAAAPDTKRSVAQYPIPDLRLVRDDDRSVSLRDEINDGRPVVVSFIYTTCTTVCPVTSATLAELQARLGAAQDRVHLVSISIDPEQDTPARLRAYARQFHAGSAWQHYTGTVAATAAVQHAFQVYSGDKMDHAPVTLLRTAPDQDWVRIDGFATAEQLLAELQSVVSAKVSAK